MSDHSCARTGPAPAEPLWGAVFASAFSVAAIITAEFLPVSLLTPMATDMGITEGMAGQSVTLTALLAIFASLLASRVTRGLDRKWVTVGFSLIMLASCALVAVASSFSLLLLARALLGVALGGFWSMSASLALRLVPAPLLPRALSIIFGGVSVALVAAAPLGSYFGALFGWRAVFGGVAVMGALCALWQLISLPPMPDEPRTVHVGLLAVARRPGVAVAMLAIFCVFAGQFAFFTYMRPFLERITGLDVEMFSTLLLGFGLANFLGTSLAAVALKASLRRTLLIAPLVMGLGAMAFILAGHNVVIAVATTLLWGLAFGAVPVGWSTWVTRHLEDAAESAGGLQVAVIQIANSLGAALGGYLLDLSGPRAPLALAGLFFVATCVAVFAGVRSHRNEAPATA